MHCVLSVLLLFSCLSSRTFVVNALISHGQEKGFFWHVTDIHVDQNYSRRGNPYQLCHENGSGYPDNGLYGNFLCDAPEYLVNVTIQSMKLIKSDPDFIIWTGDNLPHTLLFDPDWNSVFEAINNITELLHITFPGVTVLPCIGNHDTFPPNVLLPDNVSYSVYKGYLEKGGWNRILPKATWSAFLTGGYYSYLIKPGLRIISLNTILWYSPNNSTEKLSDPGNQLNWMTNVLQGSFKASEKVYIIGHVPPGFYNRVPLREISRPTFHPQYLNSYLKILKKFSGLILGQLFGHLHMDMFQLFQSNTGVFVSSSLLASSVTPWHYKSESNVSLPVNPSIRLMHYSHESFMLMDYDQFYLNLTKVNQENETQVWKNLYELLYTFTDIYNVPDLSTESLVCVYENLRTNPVLFDKFFKFSTAGKESVTCDITCKVAQLCSIAFTSIEEYNFCMENANNDTQFLCHDACYSSESLTNIVIYSFVFFVLLILLSVAFCIYFQKKRPLHKGIQYKPVSSF